MSRLQVARAARATPRVSRRTVANVSITPELRRSDGGHQILKNRSKICELASICRWEVPQHA